MMGRNPSPTACDFQIVDETDEFAVVDKPPFLLVHPSKPSGPRTLWSELQNLFAFEIANGGQISIVNRLDRETSGLMLVAKTHVSARRFGLLMQQQRIGKEYLAIVRGWPEWDRRTVDAPIARAGAFGSSRIWLKQTIHPEGAPARTELIVEKRFSRRNDCFSIVHAMPQTGRTHQIRVHLAHVGLPIVSDPLYGGAPLLLSELKRDYRPSREGTEHPLIGRVALHAESLTVAHPVTKAATKIESPWPRDLEVALKYLRKFATP